MKKLITWTIIHIIIIILMTGYILLISAYEHESGICWDGYEDGKAVGGCDLETETRYPPFVVLFYLIAISSAVIFLTLFIAFGGS